MSALTAEELQDRRGALATRRWLRPMVQWLGVGLAHAVVLALILHISPQARRLVGEVIQASLIAPQVKPPPPPPEPAKPAPPRKVPPPAPLPVLAVAPATETSPTSFVVPAPPPDPAPVDPAPVPPAAVAVPPPLPPVVPPIYNAAYLENPPPVYPPASRRFGEKGRVLLRVFVSVDGRAERVDIKASSGFNRLDQAARDAVGAWRFVPARRGDEQLAAWVLVPVIFVM